MSGLDAGEDYVSRGGSPELGVIVCTTRTFWPEYKHHLREVSKIRCDGFKVLNVWQLAQFWLSIGVCSLFFIDLNRIGEAHGEEMLVQNRGARKWPCKSMPRSAP